MFWTKWRVTIPAKVPQEGGPVAVFFNIIDCACISAYIIYSEVTNQNLTRREFLLQLIKEMCGDRSAKSDSPPLPTMVVESSSQTLRNGKQCQLQLCRNKSGVSCHKCLKSCCDRHTSSIFVVATCSSCAVEQWFSRCSVRSPKAPQAICLLIKILRLTCLSTLILDFSFIYCVIQSKP